MNKGFNIRKVLIYLAWVLALVALCMFTSGIGFVIMLPLLLFVMATQRDELLFYVILLSVCLINANHFFVPLGIVFMVTQKIILMLCAIILGLRIFGRKNSQLVTPLLWIFPYLIYMAFVSQKGWAPNISNLKLLLFTLIYIAYYGCAVRMTHDRTDVRTIRAMFLTMAIFFGFGSILVMPFPGISMMGYDELLTSGYDMGMSLYKGMTWHSQSLGLFSVLFAVFLLGDMLFGLRRPNKLYIALILCDTFLVYKSSSRTSMGSLAAGVFFLVWMSMLSRGLGSGFRRKFISGSIMFGILGLFVVLVLPAGREKVLRFVTKSHSGDTTLSAENILASRQSKNDLTYSNWQRSPTIGNGFQVSEEMSYVKINGIKDMLSAPVEKGFWIYAILEEGGVIGLCLFILFIVMTLGLLVKRRAYIAAALLFTFIFINLGEFVIFSMTASGGVAWCLIFAAIVFDHKRIRSQQMMAARYFPR